MKPLKKAISILDRIYNGCVDSLFHVAEALVIILMLVIVADVILRYSVKSPITWGFEFSEYTLLYLTFLGTAWLLRSDGHVKLDVLVNALKPVPQAYLNFIASIILVITCILLLWYGATSTADNFQRGITSVKYYSIPKFIFLIIIPIGSFLLIIQALKRTSNSFRLLKQPKG